MKILSIFNNKGGVGKSTLAFHLGYALNELGHKTLLIDLDPQCNLTLCGIMQDSLHEIWSQEDAFIEDFEAALQSASNIEDIFSTPRSIHFLLKPAEDGVSEITNYPPPVTVDTKLDLLPGRLSIHKYENKIAQRWSEAFLGDNLGIRTITNIRRLCEQYTKLHDYEYVIIDTSPSLGILNKTIISTVDGFLIPTQPDMFSLYGIRNIGDSLRNWKNEFDTLYKLISTEKRKKFPNKFVQFIGYTIYNAKRNKRGGNVYNLASAHYAYAQKIPKYIDLYIDEDNRAAIDNINNPIGNTSVMYSHNTFPSCAQLLACPIWKIPEVYQYFKTEKPQYLEDMQISYNTGHNERCKETLQAYKDFAQDFIKRVEVL